MQSNTTKLGASVPENKTTPNPAQTGAAKQCNSTSDFNATLPKLATDYIRVSNKYACKFELKDGQLSCTWSPYMPSRTELRAMWAKGKYQAARHEFLTSFSERTGKSVLCIDLPGGAQ